MKFQLKYLKDILIVGFMLYIFISNNNRVNVEKHSKDRIDSILKTLVIPEKKGEFRTISPQPIIITIPERNSNSNRLSDELLKRFEQLESDNAKTRAYAKAIALKVYEKTYKDSLVSITVKDSIEGGDLTSQNVSWNIKKQEIKYHDKIITKYPLYSISGGIGVNSVIDETGSYKTQISPLIGYRNKEGWQLEVGTNIFNLKEFRIDLTKDIFTKYRKNKKIEF